MIAFEMHHDFMKAIRAFGLLMLWAGLALPSVRQAVEHQPNVLFVHFGGVDVAGHAAGWGSPDQAFGLIEDALRAEGVLDSALMILTADHGGVGVGRPLEAAKSQLIPWIAVGPGVRRGFDLDAAMDVGEVRTMAAFATVCAILELHSPQPLDAAPVLEILELR